MVAGSNPARTSKSVSGDIIVVQLRNRLPKRLGKPVLDRLVGAERRFTTEAPGESPPVGWTTYLSLIRQAVGNDTGEMKPTATTASGAPTLP